MPLALLTQIPAIYRILAILTLVASVFGYGFVKGLHYEHDRYAALQAEVFEKQMKDAAELNKKLSDQLFDSKSRQEEMNAKNAVLRGQLNTALSKKPEYVSKQCEISEDVKKSLNDQVQNSWRNKK